MFPNVPRLEKYKTDCVPSLIKIYIVHVFNFISYVYIGYGIIEISLKSLLIGLFDSVNPNEAIKISAGYYY